MRECFEEKGTVILGFLSSVIAGLDPVIHREGSRVLVEKWIPGSKPEGDEKQKALSFSGLTRESIKKQAGCWLWDGLPD